MDGPGGRIDDALFFTGVLALIFALSIFLYVADPLLRHDVNRLWRAIGGIPWLDRD